MPSYLQLAQEPVWGAQYVPPVLTAALVVPLRHFYGLGPSIGAPGDNNHLYGRHRSRDWDLTSSYCTNRGYGTQDARDRAGAGGWYRACDVGIQGQTLYAASRRMDALARSGGCPGLAEWFGTVDGVHVIGWYEGRPSSSDSSHLYHLHVGVWNQYANDPATMQLLYATITGTGEDDMALTAIQTKATNGDTVFIYPWNHTWSRVPKAPAGQTGTYWPLQNKLDALRYAGVSVNATVWPGPYDMADPGIVPFFGVEVKAEGEIVLTDAQLSQISAAAEAGAEAGAPTQAELEAAAFEGAQRAEDE